MSWYSDEEREGRKDFERNGRLGYDRDRYNNWMDESDKEYTKGFDNAKREKDSYQERRAEEILEEVKEREILRRVYQRNQEESEPYIPPNNPLGWQISDDSLPF